MSLAATLFDAATEPFVQPHVAGLATLAIPYLPGIAGGLSAPRRWGSATLLVVGAVALAPAIVAEVAGSVRRTTWLA